MKEHAIKASDSAISDIFEEDGWSNERKWIGDKHPHLWVKMLPKGGEEDGQDAKPKPPPDQPELFDPDQPAPAAPKPTQPDLPIPSEEQPVEEDMAPAALVGTPEAPSPAPEPSKETVFIPEEEAERIADSWEDIAWDVGNGPEGA